MPSKKPQILVRLTEAWMEELPKLAQQAARVYGLPEVSTPDVLMMGLDLLKQYLAQVEAEKPEKVAALQTPRPEGVNPKRGRPKKTPAAS